MTTAVEIRAPAEQTEGTRSQVLRWLKTVGENVTENEPLIEIETDKVTVEVAAPGSGVLREIVKQEREEIGPGELLGRIESVDAAVAGKATAGSGSTAAQRHAPIAQSHEKTSHDGQGHDSVLAADSSAVSRLSPAVRRLLTEHALDTSAIRGTGLGGRITVEDVMRAVAAKGDGVPVHAASTPSAKTATAGVTGARAAQTAAATATAAADVTGSSHQVPHSAVRKRIAEHMVQSLLHTAPHVTTIFEADMSAVLVHRARHRDEFLHKGAPLTLTAYFLQAAAEAIRAVPEANSRWTDAALDVFDSIHIGVATALEEGGLVVPVLRDVQSRDLFETARGLQDLVSRAREGRLTPADVRGGTFTISNHGVSGSLVATPIVINQPQSAILGIGKLEKRVTVVDRDGEDRIVVQPRCYVTLTIDHRVMDGHQANRFLQVFVDRLESKSCAF